MTNGSKEQGNDNGPPPEPDKDRKLTIQLREAARESKVKKDTNSSGEKEPQNE